MTRFARRALSALTATALLAGLLVGTPSAARAAGTIYVGPGSNSSGGSCATPNYGASSTNATTAIESAIDDGSNPSVVYLCAGTYELNNTVHIDRAVTIQGASAGSVVITPDGFEGTLLMVQVNVTITDITVDGAYKDWGVDDGNGAAILAWNDVTLTVNNSTFTNNVAGEGAAIWMDDNSTLITSNNLFQGNVAEDGGAIWFDADTVGTLSGDTFVDNHADGDIDMTDPEGGAIYMDYNYFGDASLLTVEDATFIGNTSDEDGGAICVQEADLVTVTNTTFTDNHAIGEDSSTEGGALYVDYGDLTVTGSTFTGNTAYEDGGAIALDGAENDHLFLLNNTFTNNRASGDVGADGGAVYFVAATAEFTSTTFSSNQSGRDGGAAYGGWLGEWEENSIITIAVLINGNRFSSNQSRSYGGALAFESHAQPGDAARNKFSANRSRYGADVAELGCPVSRGDTMRAWRRSGARTIVAACVSY